MPTIKDVAQYTGLSIATISKYLNGGNVLESSRALIAEAIDKLGYKVNYAARSLKTNRTMMVGVLLPSLNVPFFSYICEMMETRLKAEGYSLVLCSYYEDPKEEIEKLRFLTMQNVDGIVLVPQFIVADDILQIPEIAERKTPLVLLDRTIPDFDGDRILADNTSATYNAVEQFIIQGHKRIGFIIGPPEISTAYERKIGYERVLIDYSIPMDPELIRVGDYSIASGYRAMNELLDLPNPPTAVMGTNYEMTMGAVMVTFERKLRIPDDISFIGYDEVQRTMINLPITTVLQPMADLARNTADLLLKRMAGDYGAYPQVQRLKTELVLKPSIGKHTPVGNAYE